jgi:hypothetical protein
LGKMHGKCPMSDRYFKLWIYVFFFFLFQLLKSLTALLNKLVEVPKPYYKLSQFSQHE